MSDAVKKAVAFIGVGSNIEAEENIIAALEILIVTTSVVRSSTFYQTEALGLPDQPDFINGVWQIETAISPARIKGELLRKIEDRLRRTRTDDRFARRTIDLDLLLYNDMVANDSDLVLPHSDLERPFMYVPTLELLEQMSEETQGQLPAQMKALLPSQQPGLDLGRPLEGFTSRLRRLLQ